MSKTVTVTGMYDLLDAIEAVVKAADSSKREAVAQTIDAYSESFPDDFFWAVGPQAPTLLNRLLRTIDRACRPDKQLAATTSVTVCVCKT